MSEERIDGNASGKGTLVGPHDGPPASQIGPLRDRLEREAETQTPRPHLVDLSEILPDGSPPALSIYTPYEEELLERCLIIVDEQGIAGASVLARTNREAADRYKASAMAADARRAALEAKRLAIESLPERTDLTAPVSHLREHIPSGPFAGTRDRSWTDLWRETCSEVEYERNFARRAWKEADERFVFSELLLAAIEVRGKRDFARPTGPAPSVVPVVDLPFPEPKLLTHYAVSGERIRSDSLWMPLGQWIVNKAVSLPPGLTTTARATAIGRVMAALIAAPPGEAGEDRWVRDYITGRGADPETFSKSRLDDIEFRFKAGDLG